MNIYSYGAKTLGIIGPPEPCIVAGFDYLFSKLLVQNDATTCICDGRKWGAKYFEELSEKYGKTEKTICHDIAKHFQEVSNMASEIMSLIGDWNDMEKMLQNFGNRSIRERIGKLILSAHSQVFPCPFICYKHSKTKKILIPKQNIH